MRQVVARGFVSGPRAWAGEGAGSNERDLALSGLRVRGVTKRYGERAVVSELSLAVEPGTVASLVGPNGCGKTTTLGMIAGACIATLCRYSCLGAGDSLGASLLL